MLSKLGYGSLLAVARWWQLTWGAAALALSAVLLGGWAHADTPAARDAPGVRLSLAELRSALRHMLCARRFWLGAAATSCATCIKRSLETLSPLFFFDASPLVDEGRAAQLAVAWSLGLALSVLVGGALFNRLRSPRGKMLLMGGLMAGSALGCAAMSLLSRAPAESWRAVALRATVVFLTALGVGLPYYVPSGMFAVQFGGRHSGVVSAYLDSVSFAISGIFMEVVMGRALDDHQRGWSVVWGILSGVAVAMTALELAFLHGLLHPRASVAQAQAPQT